MVEVFCPHCEQDVKLYWEHWDCPVAPRGDPTSDPTDG
jgi:hypothetical protein